MEERVINNKPTKENTTLPKTNSQVNYMEVSRFMMSKASKYQLHDDYMDTTRSIMRLLNIIAGGGQVAVALNYERLQRMKGNQNQLLELVKRCSSCDKTKLILIGSDEKTAKALVESGIIAEAVAAGTDFDILLDPNAGISETYKILSVFLDFIGEPAGETSAANQPIDMTPRTNNEIMSGILRPSKRVVNDDFYAGNQRISK